MSVRAWSLVFLSLLAACGSLPSDPPDTGSTVFDAGSFDADGSDDAGTDAPDAGTDAPDANTDTPDANTDTPDAGTEPPDAGTDTPDASDPFDAGESPADAGPSCVMTSVDVTPAASPHVPACSVLTHASEPPSSGPHYPSWAAFRTYTSPVPRGYWIHALEHGGVVVTHHCPTGCADELAALQRLLDARPVDPFCTPPLRNRVIVTPDPLAATRFAVIAWGHALTGDCFDPDATWAFFDTHYARAPENTCFDGFDPTAPDAGVPAGCGEAADGGT